MFVRIFMTLKMLLSTINQPLKYFNPKSNNYLAQYANTFIYISIKSICLCLFRPNGETSATYECYNYIKCLSK